MFMTITILLIVIFFVAYDIFVDFRGGVGFKHILLETIVFSLLIGSALLLNHLRYKNDKEMYTNILDQNFQILSLKEKNERIGSALKNIIAEQLTQWELTESEVQIAFLLIKGFSSKKIADIRLTSEKTIRDQSSNIYRKANLNGRAELAAFFLEDLL